MNNQCFSNPIMARSDSFQESNSFNILEFIQAGILTVDNECPTQYRCICPICKTNYLTADKKTATWGCHADSSKEHRVEILKKINPIEKRSSGGNDEKKIIIPRSKRVKIARLGKDTAVPKLHKTVNNRDYKIYTEFPLSADVKQVKIEFYNCKEDLENPTKDKRSYKKIFTQYLVNGIWENKNKNNVSVPNLYGVETALKATNGYIILTEGAYNAQIALEKGLGAIGIANFNENLPSALTELKQANPGRRFVFIVDNDLKVPSQAKTVASIAEKYNIEIVNVNSKMLSEQPDDFPSNGDIVELLDEYKMNYNEGYVSYFVSKLEYEIQKSLDKKVPQAIEKPPENKSASDNAIKSPRAFAWQIAYEDLYKTSKDSYKCYKGVLYSYNNALGYYKESMDDHERHRLTEFLETLPEISTGGVTTFPHGTPDKVDKTLKWVKDKLCSETPPNPSGYVICTNGILKISINEKRKVEVEFSNHSPDFFFTTKPLYRYDPNADKETLDKVLQCLSPEQAKIMLTHMGATLTLRQVRAYTGRSLKGGLILYGTGSNGKDLLRELLTDLHNGEGVATCTLADFKQYDMGRKFGLAQLENAKANWASENASVGLLEHLEVLKSILTGEPFECERKNKQGYRVTPELLSFFNVNELPTFTGQLTAISSRYSMLYLEKTFSDNPDVSQGEFKADPRLKNDLEFRREKVLPALLNACLEALQDFLDNGLDYSCNDKVIKEAKNRTNHLHQFCEENGLQYLLGGEVKPGEIFDDLLKWYDSNGTREKIGDNKFLFHDQPKKGDKTIKSANQIIPRFLEIFPKAKVGVDKKGKNILQGIAFVYNDEIPEEFKTSCQSHIKSDSEKERDNLDFPTNFPTNPPPISPPKTLDLQGFPTNPTDFSTYLDSNDEKKKIQSSFSLLSSPEPEITCDFGEVGGETPLDKDYRGGNWCGTGGEKVEIGGEIQNPQIDEITENITDEKEDITKLTNHDSFFTVPLDSEDDDVQKDSTEYLFSLGEIVKFKCGVNQGDVNEWEVIERQLETVMPSYKVKHVTNSCWVFEKYEDVLGKF